MKALEIYKPPFHISKPYIFSSNGVMTFVILKKNDNLIKKICDALNNENVHMKFKNITYRGVFIQKNGKDILLLRGWEYLTGCGALNLPDKEAIKIQDEFRDWVVSKLKNSED